MIEEYSQAKRSWMQQSMDVSQLDKGPKGRGRERGRGRGPG